MKTTAEIGMKITAAQREFRRYSGISAEVERRGFGASRLSHAWAMRYPAGPDSIKATVASGNAPAPNTDR
ncbi:MAG: hypothetical protein WBD32_08530 [Acidobacteriaceae bacterium]